MPFSSVELMFRSFALRDSTFYSNRRGQRFGLNDTVGVVDGRLISQNLMIRLDVIVAVNFW
jgi:hypothetical protein